MSRACKVSCKLAPGYRREARVRRPQDGSRRKASRGTRSVQIRTHTGPDVRGPSFLTRLKQRFECGKIPDARNQWWVTPAFRATPKRGNVNAGLPSALSFVSKIKNSPRCWLLMSAVALIAPSTLPGKVPGEVLGRRETWPPRKMITEISQAGRIAGVPAS